MQVLNAMTAAVVVVGPEHTLRQAAERMVERNVGSAIVLDPDGAGPGIITERDMLRSIAAGQDPDEEVVGDHLTDTATSCEPGTDLEEVAARMVRGGFRHIVVCDGPDLVGVMSMRDIVRSWLQERRPVM